MLIQEFLRQYRARNAVPDSVSDTEILSIPAVRYEWEAYRAADHAPTLRDYFAAKALATIPAYRTEDVEAWEPRHFASHAYAIADAMIAARSTKKEQDQ